MSRGFGRRDIAWMAAIVVVGAAITIAFAERIGMNRGEGWDGQAYALWARNFHHEVFVRGLSPFYAQRVLPSAVVHYGMRAIGVPTVGTNVIHAFQVFNAALLVLCAVLYGRIALRAGWSRTTAWTGFVALFAGFGVARHALYYPVLTDVTAFTLGLATLWAFLERRQIVLVVLTLLAAGTWPPLVPVCALCALLPRPQPPLPEVESRWRGHAAIAVGVLAAATAVWALLVMPSWPSPWRKHWLSLIHTNLRPLTMACVVAFVGLAFHALARAQLSQSAVGYLRFLWARRWKTALILAGLVAVFAIRSWWMAQVSRPVPSMDLRHLPPLVVLETLRGPLWNVVHHVVYLGPVVLLMIARWRRIAAIAATWGPAPMLALSMTVALAVGTETRQLNHAVPMLVVLATAATADLWTVRRAIGFAVLAVAWSKIWLPIGYERYIDTYKFPNQWFIMHHGPWASDIAYCAHLAGVVVTAVALWLLLRPAQASRADPGVGSGVAADEVDARDR